MCGIVGTVNWDGPAADHETVTRMIDRVRHRGPDDRGLWIKGGTGLGHSRLSVIDLASGRQPMSNEDGTLWIVFNGEIFNYLELRKDLEARGHRFATRSDTEVIVHAYEEFGSDCVTLFNGQWAFAIWNAHDRSLFLSRDRMGVRPLYYARVNGNTFVFGSEVKALLAHPGISAELDLRSLDQIFTYWAPIPAATCFRNIYELPAAHSLTVRADDVRLQRYWRPEYGELNSASRSESDYADELVPLLEDATRIRLRSDVPVGAYVSGGIDSSIVASLIKQAAPPHLKTFSVSFDDPEFDERWFQDTVVQQLRTDHSRVNCTYADIADAFPSVVRHAERPILRAAPAPLFLLSKLARANNYKVVLTGEGADEVFGGYDIFKEAKIRHFWAAQPQSHLRAHLLRRLYQYQPGIQAQSNQYLEAFFRARPEDLPHPFFSHLPRWRLTARLKALFSEDVKATLADYDALEDLHSWLPSEYATWDAFAKAQYLETSHLLPGYILSSQGDRMSMAHGVEGRFPFLDYRVVEFANRLPSRLKMKGLREKYLLKRATAGLVPPVITARPKQPYRAPDAKSFSGPGRRTLEYVERLLAPDRVRADGLFNPSAVTCLLTKAREGRLVGVKDNMGFIGVLSTQLWLETFVHRGSGHHETTAD